MTVQGDLRKYYREVPSINNAAIDGAARIIRGWQEKTGWAQPAQPPAPAKEPWAEPVEEGNYLYHGTPEQNLEDIRRNGLQSKTRQRNDYEEGDRTPEEQELLYFERGENQNWGGKKSVQLRVNEDMLPSGVDIEEDGLRPGEFYTYHRKNEPVRHSPRGDRGLQQESQEMGTSN